MPRKLKTLEIKRLSVEEYRLAEKLPLIVVLDDVRSLHNVGSVFRTGDAFAVEAVYLCGITATPPMPEIHKTALGAENTVEWRYFASAEEAVEELKLQGRRVYAVEQCENSLMLDQIDNIFCAGDKEENQTAEEPRNPLAVVLGNEVKGVKQSVIDLCDGCIEIPQFGTKHSLNVSVAAGIIVWEFSRRLERKQHQ